MKNLILMDQYIPLGETPYVFRISKISYKWRNMSIQYAIVRIMVASLAFLICTCADSIMRVQLTRSTKALVKGPILLL